MAPDAIHPSRLDDPGGSLDSTAVLIQRTRDGDPRAREALVARYLPLLQRWAHGRLPPSARGLADTADLVQVTLLRALDRLDQFEPRHEGAFLAYLRQALMNVMRNEIRRAAGDPRERVSDQHADGAASVIEEVIGREVIADYEAALAELPAAMREAVILRLEFGMSHGEIAQAVGSPTANSARMLVSRGVVKLSRRMARHHEGG